MGFRIAVQQAELSRGYLIELGGQYDPLVQTSALSGHDNALTTVPSLPRLLPVASSRVTYDLAVQRMFRSGIVVSQDLGITRTHVPVTGAPATSEARASMSVAMPLLKDRGGVVSAASERAAQRALDASTLQLRHAIALSVLQAVVAYWNYLAAQRRLEVYLLSACR